MDRRPAAARPAPTRRAVASGLTAALALALVAAPVASSAPSPAASSASSPPALGEWHVDGPTRTIIDTLTPVGTGRVALLSQNADGVRRSADEGLTWSVPAGLAASGLGSAATSSTLAVLGSDPTHAYLVVAGSPSAIPLGVETAAAVAPSPSPTPTPSDSPADPSASPTPTPGATASPAPGGGGGGTGGPRLYASDDSGASWTAVDGDGLAGRIIFALAAVPVTGRTPVLIAADGADGIVRSIDGGVTFEVALRGIVPDLDAGGIVVTALAAGSASGVAFASTTNGIYRSTDAGATWSRVCVPEDALACGRPYVAPGDPSIVLAAAFRGASRSADGGLTWHAAGAGVLPGSEDGGIDSIAMSGGADPVAWASGSSGLFRSNDAGLTWIPWEGGLTSDEVLGSDRIAVDPGDADRVWRVHGLALFTSDDGGRAWSELPGPDPTGVTAYAALAGAGRARLVGTDEGISLRTERRWETTRPDAIALDIAIAPGAADAGPGDPGGAGDAAGPGAAEGTPDLVYAATYASGVLRSPDGGATWEDWSRGLPRGPAWDVAIPAGGGGRVLAATEYGAFERDAEGDAAWALLGAGLPDAAVRALAVTAAGDILAGLESGGVWRLPHGEDGWVRLGLGRSSVLSLAVVTPDGRSLLAATAQRGIWRSTDAGRTWRRVASTATSASVAFDPVTATAVLATGTSVRASTDGGRTWRALTGGLPAADPTATWRGSTTHVAAAAGGGFVLTTLGGTYVAPPAVVP